uniref:Uncharacterized protein n=1 Tax=Vespula pensylvanica TaxID=30213 RepID=A0A834P9F6_VESPE|nr:hypothetical protein H0235_002126 [Vespula pensylvanica]
MESGGQISAEEVSFADKGNEEVSEVEEEEKEEEEEEEEAAEAKEEEAISEEENFSSPSMYLLGMKNLFIENRTTSVESVGRNERGLGGWDSNKLNEIESILDRCPNICAR